MLVKGSNKVQQITRSGSWTADNFLNPVFYNAGGTAVTVKLLDLKPNIPYVGFTNDNLILNDEYDIEFEDPANPDNLVLVYYQLVNVDFEAMQPKPSCP
ncbi:hypothetical protein [Nonlabens agnitus]|uniref:Uncharacterized protein n=1 Tax=Nonlabens agnitus TaxID=870484 RepID=A0A2S9WXB9_9FLAO|nr:hypothetical protein [Nonlabens agnitus]PRP68105.1 hypothetical protein BST86_13920 [Nonlabens agnitus]